MNGQIPIAWAPQAGPQKALIDCPFREVFYGGARGGGKTDGVLGKWAIKEALYGDKFNAIMFRRTTVSSEDAIERSKQIYGAIGGKFNESKYIWTMPNGGKISFRYLDNVSDAEEYQGRNVTDAWVEEVGQYAHSEAIDKLFGVLRSAHGLPTQLILTGNPGGVGQHWIAARYHLIPFPEGPAVYSRQVKVRDQLRTHEYAVIPSRIDDNRILLENDPDYLTNLGLVGSEELVRAWLEGDWTAIEGAFLDGWSNRNIVKPFKLPDYWTKERSFDWGYAAPFSVGWWAVASDEYETPEGIIIPRDAIVRYREWYGAKGPNKGIRMEAEDIAQGILEREEEEVKQFGPADPSIFSGDRGPSIQERMLKEGVKWSKADNRRVGIKGMMGGWDQLRQRIRSSAKRDDEIITFPPMLYVFSTCKDFIRTVPVLQHDEKRPEDLDTDGEDHAADDTRYYCMSRPITADVPLEVEDNTWAQPTAQQIHERYAKR